jgi:hypothetical protein
MVFVFRAKDDCFLAHENEFLVETVRSRLQTHSLGVLIFFFHRKNSENSSFLFESVRI